MRPAIILSALLLPVAWGPAPFAEQVNAPPQFRATADLVSIDVSVQSGNNPVRGLTAADFTLSDNTVPQEIRVVTTSVIPLDVTLVVDLSARQAIHLEQFRSDVLAAAKLLGPADRLQILAFGTDVFRAMDFQTQSASIPIDELQTASLTAVHEALVTALMHRVASDRRHLLVAFTDGYDNISALPASTVQAVARRTETVFHLVIPPRPAGEGWIDASDGRANQPYPPLLRGEFHPRFQKVLIDAAEDTAGSAHKLAGRVKQASMLPSFKQILDEYRTSYLLQYQLAEAPREGWHDVKVSVTRRGKYTIRARRGYFIEARR